MVEHRRYLGAKHLNQRIVSNKASAAGSPGPGTREAETPGLRHAGSGGVCCQDPKIGWCLESTESLSPAGTEMS